MNKEMFWNEVMDELAEQKLVKELILKSWLRPLKVLHIANGILLIKVADEFAYQHVNSRFKAPILQAANSVDSSITEVRFTVEESVPVPTVQKEEVVEAEKKPAPVKKEAKPELAPFQHPLSPKYSFDSFISGYDNSFALKSAVAVAEEPEKNRFSPLVIYGGVGLGKSHLLHSIGNVIRKQRPKANVVLTTAEEFYYNYVSTLRNKQKDNGKEYNRFYKTFSQCDVLLFDESHNLAGKEQCQIELFRIFNELHQRGALIVFTMDREPAKLNGFEERLISRLQWGLAVEIQEPQVETKMAILSEFALREKLDLSQDVVAFIAENGPSNVREMEGILIKLLVEASIRKKDIDLETAENALNQRLLSKEQKFAIDRIISFCCDYYGVSQKQLLGKGRSKEVALCRQVGMYIAKKYTSFSYKAVGIEFKRDHSTVVHAVNAITEKMDESTEFTAEIESVIASISK